MDNMWRQKTQSSYNNLMKASSWCLSVDPDIFDIRERYSEDINSNTRL